MSLNNSGLSPSILKEYCPEAKTLFRSMSVQPGAARKKLIHKTIKDLKDAGIWEGLEGFFFFAAHDQQASRLNWINPSAAITEVGNPVWQKDVGYTAATSKYINTNINPSTLTKYSLNDAFHSLYIATDIADVPDIDVGDNVGGSAANQRILIQSRNGSDNFQYSTHAPATGTANSNSIGLFTVRRLASSAHIGFINKTQKSSGGTVTIVPNANVVIGARNISGTINTYSSRTYSFYALGKGTVINTQAKINIWNDIVYNYLNNLSAS